MLLVRLLDQLVVAEEVLDRLFLAAKLVLENFYFGLQLHVVLLDLVVEDLHLDSLIVKLLFLFSLHAVLRRLGLGRSSGMSQRGRKALAHHRVIRIRTVA